MGIRLIGLAALTGAHSFVAADRYIGMYIENPRILRVALAKTFDFRFGRAGGLLSVESLLELELSIPGERRQRDAGGSLSQSPDLLAHPCWHRI
jgi:hypothetical protein